MEGEGNESGTSISHCTSTTQADPLALRSTGSEERCGICLLDSTKSIPGQIDGCTHLFCYVCIMEWAKKVSLCPLCRLRFRSIRRPVVPALFPTERVVKIPERDQVYHPLGMESTAINEAHRGLHCILCCSSANEAYLMSCAMCDSAFHTGCVGLGGDIPEGEWYCPDCNTCRNEYSKVQPDDDDSQYVDQETREKIRILRSRSDLISIHDLVANRGSVQSDSRQISDVLRRYRRTEDTRQNPAATTPGEGDEFSNRESYDTQKAWKMLKKARLALAKEGHQNPIVREPMAHKQPQRKRPKTYGKSVSSHHSSHEVSYRNRNFDWISNNDWVCGGSGEPNRQTGSISRDPSGLISRVPRVTPSCPRREASSTIEKRDCPRREDGKAEIQSLVKHSLSALNKNKKELGTRGYKEVARVSTHTILAACEFEHEESLARAFSRLSCNHNKDTSSLVPGTCRDCFNAFIRQVVDYVFSEKMTRHVRDV